MLRAERIRVGREGEKKFEEKLRKRGLAYIPVCRTSTPDFIVFKRDYVYLVEVKTTRGSRVTVPRHQLEQLREIAHILRSCGIKVRCVLACLFKGYGWRLLDITDVDPGSDLEVTVTDDEYDEVSL